MDLTRSQRLLLETIGAHDGRWNWHQLGRHCLPRLDSPAEFSLKPLLDSGLVEECLTEGEPLPRLHLTPTGRAALRPTFAAEGTP